jgi:hypothetical protein
MGERWSPSASEQPGFSQDSTSEAILAVSDGGSHCYQRGVPMLYDPVCGGRMNRNQAYARVMHEHITYYLC